MATLHYGATEYYGPAYEQHGHAMAHEMHSSYPAYYAHAGGPRGAAMGPGYMPGPCASYGHPAAACYVGMPPGGGRYWIGTVFGTRACSKSEQAEAKREAVCERARSPRDFARRRDVKAE